MKRLQFNKWFPTTTRKKITSWWHFCLFLVASLTMGAIIIDYGYIQHPYENEILENIYNNTWWIYCLSYLFSILTYWKRMSGKRIITTIIWGILLAKSFSVQTIWALSMADKSIDNIEPLDFG